MSENSFFSRWSQRKQQNEEAARSDNPSADQPTPDETSRIKSAQVDESGAALTPAQPAAEASELPMKDEDMPDLSTINGNSNVSAFFSEGVSEKLRKQALKAMFLKPEFNIRDGMDDYDLNYADAPELAAGVAAGLRKWLKEQDPLNLKHDQDTRLSPTPTQATAQTHPEREANVSDKTEPLSTNQETAPEQAKESQLQGASPLNKNKQPEPDQKNTDLASGKTTTADPASGQPE